jgi:hypothetical protein
LRIREKNIDALDKNIVLRMTSDTNIPFAGRLWPFYPDR